MPKINSLSLRLLHILILTAHTIFHESTNKVQILKKKLRRNKTKKD